MCSNLRLEKEVPYEGPRCKVVGDLNSIDDTMAFIQVKTVARNKQTYVENYPVIHNGLIDKLKAGDRVRTWGDIVQIGTEEQPVTYLSAKSMEKVAKNTPYEAIGKLVGRLTRKWEWDRNPETGQGAWGFATFATSDDLNGGLYRCDFFDDLATALKGWPRRSVIQVVGFLRHKFVDPSQRPMVRIAAANDATRLISRPAAEDIDPFLSQEAAMAYTVDDDKNK